MARVVVSRLAQLDEIQITRDLAEKAGWRVASKYAARFDELYRRLSRHPELGAPRASLGTGVRLAVVSPYLVFHRYDGATDAVTILRLLHGRRKLSGSMLR